MIEVESLPSQSVASRATTSILPPTEGTPSFILGAKHRTYKHQYSNIYFVRLRILRQLVEQAAERRWHHIKGNPVLIPNVLEIQKSQLCYIVGTVYMDMPLKPNVMEDIARDHSIPPPPPPDKFYSPEDNVMLEDESGRVKLIGEPLKAARLVTGVIVGVLGMETPNGEFEVIDICYPGIAPQPSSGLNAPEESMEVDGQQDEWIGIISGLSIGAPSQADGPIQMLIEYLTGEEGGLDDQVSASQISRLIIAGNSLAPLPPSGRDVEYTSKKARKFGQDISAFTMNPTKNLSQYIADIARVMPVHILPGYTDPSGVILPQQPFPKGMFGSIASFPALFCETNPTYLRVTTGIVSDQSKDATSAPDNPGITRTILVNSGQPLNDLFKYLPSSNSRLSLLESTLRWRHMAPTAPDTLWCHPYFDEDPFMIQETPHIYIVGDQKKFGTKMVVDRLEDGGDEKTRCRLILVPTFSNTGVLVLVNLRSLDVKTITFGVQGMTGDGKDLEPKVEAKRPSPTPQLQASPSSSPTSAGSPMS
ncbi:DNA polymerase alpha/epsilon subunit B-domain-containing protein [Mycena floridula]|nr:DNA polymerase alpha/epsilon subunit B-domain-containing protein [Mycena floridula]